MLYFLFPSMVCLAPRSPWSALTPKIVHMEYSKPIYFYWVFHKQWVWHVAKIFGESFSQWKWPHPALSSHRYQVTDRRSRGHGTRAKVPHVKTSFFLKSPCSYHLQTWKSCHQNQIPLVWGKPGCNWALESAAVSNFHARSVRETRKAMAGCCVFLLWFSKPQEKYLCNYLKWTKPKSSPFVFQKLSNFLDSIIKEGLKCSKPTPNVVDVAMLPEALSKYARALQAEWLEKGQILLGLALFAQMYFSRVVRPLQHFPSTYLFGWCYLRCLQ